MTYKCESGVEFSQRYRTRARASATMILSFLQVSCQCGEISGIRTARAARDCETLRGIDLYTILCYRLRAQNTVLCPSQRRLRTRPSRSSRPPRSSRCDFSPESRCGGNNALVNVRKTFLSRGPGHFFPLSAPELLEESLEA